MLLREEPREREVVTSFADYLQRAIDDGRIDAYQYDTGYGLVSVAGKYVIDNDGDVHKFASHDDAVLYAQVSAGPQDHGEDIRIHTELLNGTSVYYALDPSYKRQDMIAVGLEWVELMPAVQRYQEKEGVYGNVWLMDDYSYGAALISGTWDDESKSVVDWHEVDQPMWDRRVS